MSEIEKLANVCGLFELDAAGTIMYSKVLADNFTFNQSKKFVGSNFFDDLVQFDNVEDFRNRFRSFLQSADPIDKFNFTCHFNQSPVELKVMLTYVHEREYNGNSKLVIVDIRKV